MGEQFVKQLMESHENTKTRKLQLQQAPAQTQQNRVNTTVMDDPRRQEAKPMVQNTVMHDKKSGPTAGEKSAPTAGEKNGPTAG